MFKSLGLPRGGGCHPGPPTGALPWTHWGLKRPPDPSPNNFAPPICNSWLRPCLCQSWLIGHKVLKKKKTKMGKVNRLMDRRTTYGHQTIRKAHPTIQLLWAYKQTASTEVPDDICKLLLVWRLFTSCNHMLTLPWVKNCLWRCTTLDENKHQETKIY